jgi:hypothetical protein
MRQAALLLLLALGAGEAAAQQSTSHTFEEHVFNAGGHPRAGVAPASASHRLTLGSIGDPFAFHRAFGTTMTVDSSFVLAYGPPAEVESLRFTNPTTLVWNPHHSAGRYNVYRDSLTALAGLGYGACAQEGLVAPTATDTLPIPPGSGRFFLVTVENRLAEEGTKGFGSGGVERTGTVCP